MLLLTLIAVLASDPAAAPPAPTAMGPLTVRSTVADPAATPRVIRPVAFAPVRECGAARVQPAGGLLGRDVSVPNDGKVRMYHLFSLEVAGCPIPVIARDSIPEADDTIEMNRLLRP